MNEDYDAYDLARTFDEREASVQALDWESKRRVHETIEVIEIIICLVEQFIRHAQDFKRKLESQRQELYDIVSPS
ncbi:MAG: hypothetical protein CV045_12200 [Cyanobacteria bacterium M5B4]|nr:MAG: hypothetical protein CV045_12200 [Cyanobacteria bacterium M5B4]